MIAALTRKTENVAFYYPGHIWHDDDWVKNLLIFFDGVGLLVPEYKLSEVEHIYPHSAGVLRDRGLLHYLVADKAVDGPATEAMAGPILKLIDSGRFDDLAGDGEFHSISFSRMGYYGNEELALEIYSKLRAKGLAKESADGLSIPIKPAVRYLILSILAQVIKDKAGLPGVDLCPATDRPELIAGLSALLDQSAAPSKGSVVQFDLKHVGVDLSAVPIDEVLSFRAQHGPAYRSYAQSVRRFCIELSQLPEQEQQLALSERKAELDDLASDLATTGRSAWRQPATFALGVAGMAWTAYMGDWVGSAIAGAAAMLGGIGSEEVEAGAFSYLFEAKGLHS